MRNGCYWLTPNNSESEKVKYFLLMHKKRWVVWAEGDNTAIHGIRWDIAGTTWGELLTIGCALFFYVLWPGKVYLCESIWFTGWGNDYFNVVLRLVKIESGHQLKGNAVEGVSGSIIWIVSVIPWGVAWNGINSLNDGRADEAGECTICLVCIYGYVAELAKLVADGG